MRFRTFDLEKCFCHEILHRYSAPGFYQRISDAKVRAVCVHAFHSFHRLCFYIFFLPLKINSINSEAPKTITRYPILFIFFYLLLKQNFQAYERNGSIAEAPQGIEPALNRFCPHFFGHPYGKSWST